MSQGGMVYIRKRKGAPPPPAGARKYVGEVAEGYDAKREQSPKWKAEQNIVEDMLGDLPAGATVLDCPVGTGRFLPFYNSRSGIVLVYCMDQSPDMLALASKKVVDARKFRFAQGDIRKTGLPDKSADCSVMVRLTRWLMPNPQDCIDALQELGRVTRRRIILTARVRNHQFACPYDLIQGALPDWRIERDDAADSEDYRVIMMEPA